MPLYTVSPSTSLRSFSTCRPQQQAHTQHMMAQRASQYSLSKCCEAASRPLPCLYLTCPRINTIAQEGMKLPPCSCRAFWRGRWGVRVGSCRPESVPGGGQQPPGRQRCVGGEAWQHQCHRSQSRLSASLRAAWSLTHMHCDDDASIAPEVERERKPWPCCRACCLFRS